MYEVATDGDQPSTAPVASALKLKTARSESAVEHLFWVAWGIALGWHSKQSTGGLDVVPRRCTLWAPTRFGPAPADATLPCELPHVSTGGAASLVIPSERGSTVPWQSWHEEPAAGAG